MDWSLWLTTFTVLLLLVIGTLLVGSYAVAQAPGGAGGSSQQAMFGWIMIAIGIVAALATIAIGIYAAVMAYEKYAPAVRGSVEAASSEFSALRNTGRIAKLTPAQQERMLAELAVIRQAGLDVGQSGRYQRLPQQ